MLEHSSSLTVLLGFVATAFLVATARAEAENVARFGGQYREYMARTRRFIPLVV